MALISRKIHYCWFGKNKKSKLIKKCIKTWHDKLPGYEIIEWNESNFDINAVPYVLEAYQQKKWAFVTDYVRLWAIHNFGGIYLDTDVEVFQDLSLFLDDSFFTGFENYADKLSPVTAVMGAQAGHPLVQNLLSDYADLHFINKDGSLNLETNTRKITQSLIEKYGIDADQDVHQSAADGINIYPSDYFCNRSGRSFAMHHFDGSWLPRNQKIKRIFKGLVR